MSDKANDACLSALQFVSVWFCANKMLGKRDVVFSNEHINLAAVNSWCKLYKPWLLQILIILNLVMIILMKMTLLKLFLLDLLLGISDLKNLKHVRKYERKTNAYIMAYNQLSGWLLYDKSWKNVEWLEQCIKDY